MRSTRLLQPETRASVPASGPRSPEAAAVPPPGAVSLPLQVLVFASMGVTMEVVFTAVAEFARSRDARLHGFTYVWMIPIYGIVPLALRWLRKGVGGLPLPARLAAYVALVFLAEYASGWALRQVIGEAPWERNYRGARWALGSLIRLDYAPAWALACWIFEAVYLRLIEGVGCFESSRAAEVARIY